MLFLLYKILFTIVSFLLLAVFFLINRSIDLEALIGFSIPPIISYSIYIITSLFLSWLCTLAMPKLESVNICGQNIKMVESADYTMVPMYIAYVFLGVSLQSMMSLLFCYSLITIICFRSQSYLFNPLFYVLGYKFYFITNSENKKLLLMTKNQIYFGQKFDSRIIKKLNDYTYVDTNVDTNRK